MAWYAFAVLEETWRLDARSISTLRVPLIWPQSIWFAGFIWFATMACLASLFAIERLVRRDFGGAEALISNPQLSDEMDEIGIETQDSEAER